MTEIKKVETLEYWKSCPKSINKFYAAHKQFPASVTDTSSVCVCVV